MDKCFDTGMVMIDLQKAFATVNHGILLHQLKVLRFYDLSVSWLESHLKNRNQKSEINGTFSTSGIHFGDITFSHFMSTIWKLRFLANFFLYADDSVLLVSGGDVGLIEEKLGIELSSLNGWLFDNHPFRGDRMYSLQY